MGDILKLAPAEEEELAHRVFAEWGRRGAMKRWARHRGELPPEEEKKPALSVEERKPLEYAIERDLRRMIKTARRVLSQRVVEMGAVPFRRQRLRGKGAEEYVAQEWPGKIVREWEVLLDVAKAQGNWLLVKDVLAAMTAMSPLSPIKLKSTAAEVLGLPSDADLSHLTDEDLAKITQKPILIPPDKPAASPGRRKAKPKKEEDEKAEVLVDAGV